MYAKVGVKPRRMDKYHGDLMALAVLLDNGKQFCVYRMCAYDKSVFGIILKEVFHLYGLPDCIGQH